MRGRASARPVSGSWRSRAIGFRDGQQRGTELRQARQPALDRGRDHRGDHLPLLRDRLARALAPSVRSGRGALVGGLHRRLRPPAPGRATALADGLRAPRHRAADRPYRPGGGNDPARRRDRLRPGRPRSPRPDRGRPPGRQRDPVLDRGRRGHRLRGQLLRPRLSRRKPPAHPLRRPDHLRVALAHPLPPCGRARDRLGPGRRRPRDRRRPNPVADRRPVRVPPPGGRSGARRWRRPAAAPCRPRSEFTPRARGRLRGGGLPDHAQRADLPQRRSADRQRAPPAPLPPASSSTS